MSSLRFVSQWPPMLVLGSALLIALLALWLYRRELRKLDVGAAGWWLPLLRSLAIFLIVLTLAEPIIESRKREGEPGRVLILLDGSESMSVGDSSDVDSASRFERASTHLMDPVHGVLPQLASEFEISARRFGSELHAGDGTAIRLWESNLGKAQELPVSAADWLPPTWGQNTAIGDSLVQSLDFAKESTSDASSVVVLLSDGQSNHGQSPIAMAEALAAAGTPLFTIGYGPVEGLPDLSLASVNTPQRVYRSDVLQGTLVIVDHLPAGTPFVAELMHGDDVVWKRDMIADGQGRREIAFDVSVDPMFKAESDRLPHGVEYATMPLKLTSRLTAKTPEANLANNQRDAYLSVASQKSRLLLVDGRSRWETRYLKNVFSRDPAWQIDTVLEHAAPRTAALGEEHADEPGSVQLPRTREELSRYNLIILGDVDAGFWQPEQLTWLSDFVQRGGGLILIDGARKHLRGEGYAPIAPLLPIRWLADNGGAMPNASSKRTELAPAGAALEAFKLTADANEDNAALWLHLPPLQFVSNVEVLPGSEVLVEAVSDADRQPLFITRRFGAGRVLFSATDETWRWRYKVADLVHQRFWNQIARWAMRVPMSVQGEFVSLDTGAASVELGQAIEVHCSLSELNGTVGAERSVTAVVYRDGDIVARVPLGPAGDLPGHYSGELRSLPAGDYHVQIEAGGFPKEALEAVSKFSIVAPQRDEMQQLTRNEALLQQLAEITGGTYLPEENVQGLVELLRPISGGRITQSATILWQSYWWFVTAIILLVIEWILRKRNGLI